MRVSPHRRAGVFLLAFLVGSVGCSGKSPGTVSGKVYLQDKPLKGGNVTFLKADKKVSQMAKIGEDGSYTIENFPSGPVKIGVETKSLKQAASVPRNAAPPGQKSPNSTSPDPKEILKRYVAIPEKYADPEGSGLEYTVQSGKQPPFDIKLKSAP